VLVCGLFSLSFFFSFFLLVCFLECGCGQFKSIKSLEEALQKVNLSYFRSSVSTSSSTQRSQQAAEQEALEREADVLISQCQQSLKQLQSSIGMCGDVVYLDNIKPAL
jgi:hypothetical protein